MTLKLSILIQSKVQAQLFVLVQTAGFGSPYLCVYSNIPTPQPKWLSSEQQESRNRRGQDS